MGSHVLEILRQGLWASLTGGWFYDPRHGIFCNTVHLYIWLFLLCFPLTLYLTLPSDLVVWTIYSAVIGGLFLALKLMNHRLHYIFDTSESIEDEDDSSTTPGSHTGDHNDEDPSKTTDTAASKSQTQGLYEVVPNELRQSPHPLVLPHERLNVPHSPEEVAHLIESVSLHSELTEGIEMAMLSSSSQHPSITPPVMCSSRASMAEGNSRGSGGASRKGMTPADSMEYINRIIRDDLRSSCKDTRVDVHSRQDSQGSEIVEGAVGGKSLSGSGDINLDMMSGYYGVNPTEGAGESTASLFQCTSQDNGDKIMDKLPRLRRRTKEMLNEPLEDITDSFICDMRSARNTNPSGRSLGPNSPYRRSSGVKENTENVNVVDETQMSPSRIKPRRHRKAVRRSRTTEPSPRNHSMDVGANNSLTSGAAELESPARGARARRQISLPDRFVSRRETERDQSSSPRKQAESHEHDTSSLSSYKETSPETEVANMLAMDNVSPISYIPSVEFRPKTITPSTRTCDKLRSRNFSGSKLGKDRSRQHSGMFSNAVRDVSLSTGNSPIKDLSHLKERQRSRSLVEEPSREKDSKRSSQRSSQSVCLPAVEATPIQDKTPTKSSVDHSDSPSHNQHRTVKVCSAKDGSHDSRSDSTSTLTEQVTESPRKNMAKPPLKSTPIKTPSSSTSKKNPKVTPKDSAADSNGKPKDHCASLFKLPAFLRESHELQNSDPVVKTPSAEEQLDWLFSSDSDSVSSGSLLSDSYFDLSDSLSTITNDDTTPMRDSSPDGIYPPMTEGDSSIPPHRLQRQHHRHHRHRQPHHRRRRRCHNPSSTSSATTSPDSEMRDSCTDTGSLLDDGHSAARTRHIATQAAPVTSKNTSPGTESGEDEDQGDADEEDEEDDEDLSQGIADTVELSRRLLEILSLSDPAEAEEELKKLKDELNARKEKLEGEPDCETPSKSAERQRRSRSRHGHKLKSRVRNRLKAVTAAEPEDPTVTGEKASSSRESSASNHNESSALLPERRPPGAEPEGDVEQGTSGAPGEYKGSCSERRRHSSRGSKHSIRSDTAGAPAEIESALVTEVAPGLSDSMRHVATTHSDTTEGAVHCFQDEFGNWFTYTFGENSTGVAQGILPATPANKPNKPTSNKWIGSSTESLSGSTVIVDVPPNHSPVLPRTHPQLDSFDYDRPSLGLPMEERVSGDWPQRPSLPSNIPMSIMNALLERRARSDASSDSDTLHNINASEEKHKFYFKFYFLPKKFFKIRFDRLALFALFDKNTAVETAFSVFLAVGVSVLGAALLAHGFYIDFWIFLFCFVMASCQYSLFKSVQPDAASPMHGYNRIILFSRPFYFCMCGGLVLALHYASEAWSGVSFTLYGLPFTAYGALRLARDVMKIVLLCFPIVFTVGLLPQINTFLVYLLEQIEIHVFGGNATTGLCAAVFTVSRSCIAVALLYGFCYAGIKDPPAKPDKPNTAQHVLFSVFCGVLVPLCYHLSRSPADCTVLGQLMKCALLPEKLASQTGDEGEDMVDPLPAKLRTTVFERLRSDLIVCCLVAVLVFAVSVSTVFSSPVLQPTLFSVLAYLAGCVGILTHYLIPQLRKEMPWLCCAHPILPSHERSQFEVRVAAKVMWFERVYSWLRLLERNILCPTLLLNGLTQSARTLMITNKFPLHLATLIIVVCSLKMFRSAFSDTPRQYLIIVFTVFFFKYDYSTASETFLIDYFFISIIFYKMYDLLLKVKFILTYIAPWQITWGSAFHAFAQPFSVPHSAMLFVQAIVSAIFSTPLNPLLGSAIFVTSYVRPIKFWERDYNTKRVDHTNTRLSSQLDRNPGADDNNLNSIFYEHLTRSLQHSLCGDLMLGRWGCAQQGDCFIIASDYLNALVHIVEMGNGLVTFQLRGLEFRGTYCQQREVEAITEGVEEDDGFCCCEPGHLPHFLSLNAAFNQRWLAWEVLVTKYVLEGYSISDNSAASMLQVFDLRKVLITYYVKSIIYYTVRSPKLSQWLQDETITAGLEPTQQKSYVDVDPIFTSAVDEDYDHRMNGVSKNSFCEVYHEWIVFCAQRRDKSLESGRDSWLVSLCYGLGLLGRRALSTAAHNNSAAGVDFFLFGLHALFKGDFRFTSARDEWVFTDMEMLRRVVAPGVRMSLKLHQDHFTSPDEYDNHEALYTAITEHEQTMVISHEADPAWRNAVLSNVPSLLALRHVFDEGSDEYKVIMLNKRCLSFRVIKVNRECVRGLWAGQLQELIFLRNRNPERGSIQNAKQALRNMINSSCDQPIGYPIYVSPLTTSYAGTNEQYSSVVGKEFSLNGVYIALRGLWRRMRARCGASCASGSSMMGDDACGGSTTPGPTPHTPGGGQGGATGGGLTPAGHSQSQTASEGGSLAAFSNRGSLVSTASTISKPTKMQIVDPSLVFDNINLGRRIDPLWPNEDWRLRGGKNHWRNWVPERGMDGSVVHRWMPCHREQARRSHVDKTIVLLKVGDKYVPIAENGVTDLAGDSTMTWETSSRKDSAA